MDAAVLFRKADDRSPSCSNSSLETTGNQPTGSTYCCGVACRCCCIICRLVSYMSCSICCGVRLAGLAFAGPPPSLGGEAGSTAAVSGPLGAAGVVPGVAPGVAPGIDGVGPLTAGT